ncbi:hypothetical protein E4U21_003205 [Claviceps maximensis]|nr:hypothetical protein E4U21_003205 [Claviceps maximensis]
MASFAAKRKARVIRVDEEDISNDSSASSTDSPDTKKELGTPIFGAKPARKPFRQSGLRQTFNANDESDANATSGRVDTGEEDDGPVVVRPSISRAGSTKQKKKAATKSRLSFGGDTDHGDVEELATPQKSGLGKRALENSAVKRGIALRTLPSRSTEETEDDRPRYSKEYLDELQSSTPSTPRDVSILHPSEGDDMELDLSELDGAVVVEYSGVASPKSGTQMLSEAEIREKKERRARLAKEHDVLSLEDDDATIFSRKKEDQGRLIAEDEDLGEGFDNYVEDGGLSLGKRAERERRRKDRQQMAELITAAEGHSSDDSSESEAERRMAYEASQSKAGLDGLKKSRKDASQELLQVPPKITPLPSVSECLARLQTTLKAMESDLKTKNAYLEHLRKEREGIDKRKAEVQLLLDETGKKYQEAMRRGNMEPSGTTTAGELSSAGPVGERGLDSLGTTPRRPSLTEGMDLT